MATASSYVSVTGPGGIYRTFAGNLPTLPEAQAVVDQVAVGPPGQVEWVNLFNAMGRVLARDVSATADIPPFHRSTVDGYAVRSSDVAAASVQRPVPLRWRGEIKMGQQANIPVGPGEAVGVATGGMLPAGADAVVMVEHTQAEGETIYVKQAARSGDNILPRAADVKAGQLLLAQGTRLGPAQVGVLAGSGITAVPVTPRPRVAIVVTGDEIVPPDVEPAAGQIRDMNSYSLAAAVARDGAEPVPAGRVSDSLSAVAEAVKEATENADLVLISGGSSVGVKDATAEAVQSIGGSIYIHGIAIKPGKPTLIATLGDVLIVGLPGNPVSALVIYEVLVRRALWKRMGIRDATASPPVVSARLTTPVRRPSQREELVRVRLRRGSTGYLAEPVAGTSGMLLSLAAADGLLYIPFSREGFDQGEVVEIWLLPGW